jgi:hypothetical protein
MSDIKFSGVLEDFHTGDNTKVPFTVVLAEGGTLWFGAEGYGDCGSQDGCGLPVKVEWYEGQLWVLIWADINSEDPTHKISLAGARESERRAE